MLSDWQVPRSPLLIISAYPLVPSSPLAKDNTAARPMVWLMGRSDLGRVFSIQLQLLTQLSYLLSFLSLFSPSIPLQDMGGWRASSDGEGLRNRMRRMDEGWVNRINWRTRRVSRSTTAGWRWLFCFDFVLVDCLGEVHVRLYIRDVRKKEGKGRRMRGNGKKQRMLSTFSSLCFANFWIWLG